MNDPLSASPRVTAGVDTHKDTHTAAALDGTGMLLGNATLPASPAGYAQLLEWLRSFGALDRVGIEGTGSYGSGLMQFLHDAGVNVIEVNRPNRQARRRHGKSDPADAVAAARATLARDALGVPKSQVEVIRILRLERRSAIRARTQAANQLHAVVSTAPEPLRGSLRESAPTPFGAWSLWPAILRRSTRARAHRRRACRSIAPRRVNQRAALVRYLRELVDWLQRAGLVVRVHDGHEDRVAIEVTMNLADIDAAESVHADDVDAPAMFGEIATRLRRRGMFDLSS